MSLNSTTFSPDAPVVRDPLTSLAYFETSSKPRDFVVSVHADMLKVHHPQIPGMTPLKHTGGIRSTIKGLSRASRKRMIEFMASVRTGGASMLFVTLTYPDVFPLDSAIWHRHFEAFRDRFENHYANHRALWRIELMDRKSGENTGVIAPHWHLIVFLPLRFEPHELEIEAALLQTELRQAWYEIVNSGDEQHRWHGVDVAPVKSRKHAYHYVSKYVAKETGDMLEIGRRWGRIGQFDNSESIKVLLSYDEILILRRLIRRWMKGRGGKYWKRYRRQTPVKGFAIFGIGDEDAAGWFAFIFEAFRQHANAFQLERGYGT